MKKLQGETNTHCGGMIKLWHQTGKNVKGSMDVKGSSPQMLIKGLFLG